MNSHAFSNLAIRMVAVLLGLTTFAQAGATLICHPIEIGQARSLPWSSGTTEGVRATT